MILKMGQDFFKKNVFQCFDDINKRKKNMQEIYSDIVTLY